MPGPWWATVSREPDVLAGGRAAWRDLAVAAGMAFLAGATDVTGLRLLHDLFVSFMSGNTTMLGVAIGGGDWSRSSVILGLIGPFVAGAAFGAVLAKLGGTRHAALVALVVAGLLAVPLLWPGATATMLVLAMGTLNASMTRVGAVSVGLTYVTGTLVKLGEGLGRALCGDAGGWTWLWQAPMWLSLLAGAVVATAMGREFGEAIWPLPATALVLAGAALARGPD